MKNVFIFLSLLFSLLCNGQSPKLLTADKELPNSSINQICQDRNGFIWTATEDGLNRYDGTKFVIYKREPNSEHSLAHNFVRTVLEDSKNHLLIGIYTEIQMYDPATNNFTPFAKLEDIEETLESNINSFIKRKNGEIWISGDVLCKLDIKDHLLTIRKVDIAVTSPGSLFEDKKQNVWAAKGEEGVYQLTPDNQPMLHLSRNNGYVKNICEDRWGNIYVGSIRKKLLIYDEERKTFVPVDLRKEGGLPVCFLYSDILNELYIGTSRKRVAIYSIQTYEISKYKFGNDYFDSGNSKVCSILKDNSGNS